MFEYSAKRETVPLSSGGMPMYDSVGVVNTLFCPFSGKGRKESHWCGDRCQGRRSLAFISTLDTGLHTFTIDPGTKSRVLF
jgi:hypothetical protein